MFSLPKRARMFLTPVKALSDFADYVQKQQEKRRPMGQKSLDDDEDEHDELSNILDQLDLADETKTLHLKQVLLDSATETAEESTKSLAEYIRARLEEGNGEALLDIGLEDNGDPMGFDKKDWEFAIDRVQEAAQLEKADIKLLMTRNVGGDLDVGPLTAKDTACSGKIMIRRQPETINDVIETRIAVVGNGQ